MYCGKNVNGIASKTGSWWLSSPSGGYSYYVCIVRSDEADLAFINSPLNLGVSPLVCLKSSFIPEVEE